MSLSSFARWVVIVCYLAGLFFLWWGHIPVKNIFLYFLIYTAMTCFMLIVFRFVKDSEKNEG